MMENCICKLNLKNGECYQFKYVNTLKGYYRSDTGRFYYAGGFIHASVVEDIKLLNRGLEL